MDTVEPFLVKHNRKEMISDKYRYRALHPNTEICSRRSRHIYRLVCDSPFLIVNTRFDQSTDEWVEFRRIDFQKRHDCRGIVAGNKLYVMDDKVLGIVVWWCFTRFHSLCLFVSHVIDACIWFGWFQPYWSSQYEYDSFAVNISCIRKIHSCVRWKALKYGEMRRTVNSYS